MRVRKSLTIKEKLRIIEEVKKGRKQIDIANELSIPASTVSTVVKNEKKIMQAVSTETFKAKSKRMRRSAWPDVEKALLLWIQNARQQKISLSGVLIKEKADELALKLNQDGFTASNGWLCRFKERHSLVFRTVCGEAGAVDVESTTEWSENVLLPILQEYSPEDIFNADEMGLFYNMQPNKTITFSHDQCVGGKKSKNRITVMVCANMNGTEKFPLLVIGKYKKPRCFRGITTFPVEYESNAKSWMNQDIFQRWVRKYDRKFYMKNRKVVLFVDNCSAHGKIEGLLAITLVFLPPNATALVQPMDQGIICQLKVLYRHKLLQKLLFSMDHGIPFDMNVLKAMHLIAASWKELPPMTIVNCFRHAGFKKYDLENLPSDDDEPTNISDTEKLKKDIAEKLPKNFNLQDFIHSDDCVPICATASDEDIINQVLGNDNTKDSDSEDDSEAQEKPSHLMVTQALECLQLYFSIEPNCASELSMLNKLEGRFIDICSKSATQSKIHQFFKPSSV